jgi:hypothetical protein
LIKDHVLLPQASELAAVDAACRERLTSELLTGIVDLVPDTWLQWEGMAQSPAELRAVYLEFLILRVAHSHVFLNEAQHARQALV